MSVNHAHQQYQQLLALERQPLAQQIKASSHTQHQHNLLDQFRNYGGHILYHIATPAYFDYLHRNHDLQAKVAVLNWRLQQPVDAKIDQNYLNNQDTAGLNPYKTGSFEIKQDKFVCIDTPINDHQNIRCVEI